MNDYFDPSVMVTHLSFAPMFIGAAKTVAQTAFQSHILTPKLISPEYEKLQALSEIQSYRQYEADWDGYGAAPFKDLTIANACGAIDRLLCVTHLPDITPNSNATISLEWESRFGFAHLEIGESKYSFFISMKSGEKYFRDGEASGIGASIGLMIEQSLFPVYSPTSTMSRPLILNAA